MERSINYDSSDGRGGGYYSTHGGGGRGGRGGARSWNSNTYHSRTTSSSSHHQHQNNSNPRPHWPSHPHVAEQHHALHHRNPSPYQPPDWDRRPPSSTDSRNGFAHYSVPASHQPPPPLNTTAEEEGGGITIPLKEYEAELKERTKIVGQMLEIPLHERGDKFLQLSSPQQLILFFPPDVSLESLPPLREPIHWPHRIQMALQNCTNQIPELFPSNERMMEDDDYDFDPADDIYTPSANDGRQNAHSFVKALPHCQPFLAGFHVLPLLAEAGRNTICYCPCGRHMIKWQQCFLPESMLSDQLYHHQRQQSFVCTFKGKKSPHELYKHITTLAEQGCFYHILLQTFLQTVMADYHQPGMRHIELENKGDRKHKEARAFVMKDIKKQVDTLAREAEQMRTVQQKLFEMKEHQAKLEMTNKDLAEQLQAERKLKEKYGSASEGDFKQDQLQQAKKSLDKFRRQVRLALSDACTTQSHGEIYLETSQNINVVSLFDKYYSEGIQSPVFSTLFDRLAKPTQSDARLNVIKRWTALFILTENADTLDTLETALAEHDWDEHEGKPNTLRPKDEGGPTRSFFSRTWDQIGNLKVGTLELFARSRGGLVPQTDERVTAACKGSENDLARVKAYYTAFGRLLAHAILLPPEDNGPITIAKHVLPDLFKNVLFRDLDASNEAYLVGDVIDHMGEVMDIARVPNETKSYDDRVLQYLGIEKLETGKLQGKEAQEKDLREKVQENFVESRMQVLGWIQDGLSIGGRVVWSTCLSSVPTKSLTRLLGFSDQAIRMEDVFDEHDNFRFIKFSIFSDGDSHRFCEKQNQFKRKLVDWFKKMMIEDPTYMSRFVYFCTGSNYIPDIDLNPDWFIKFEFNYSEMTGESDDKIDVDTPADLVNAFLPVVHTCDNCIKIPANAYDANMTVFERKLELSMRQTLHSFDMA